MGSQKTEIIYYSEFLIKSRKPAVRACSWKWKDIYPLLINLYRKTFFKVAVEHLSLVLVMYIHWRI
ncbi:hypothetical protein A9P44_10020 [Paenibacillus polymyxa]|nr:hypothetical protein A9P44_10020 [Paenibacillus polymyxa]